MSESPDLSDSVAASPPKVQKRKRADADGEPELDTKKAAKRKKRSKKPKDIDEADLNEELGLNVGLSRMDPRLLSDYVAQRTKRNEPKLSLLELEDRYIPGALYQNWPIGGDATNNFVQKKPSKIRLTGQRHGQPTILPPSLHTSARKA